MDFAKNVRRILICRFDDKRCCGDIYGRIASMTSKRGIILRLHFVPLYLNVPCCLIKQPRSKTRSRGYSQHSTAQSHKMQPYLIGLLKTYKKRDETISHFESLCCGILTIETSHSLLRSFCFTGQNGTFSTTAQNGILFRLSFQ